MAAKVASPSIRISGTCQGAEPTCRLRVTGSVGGKAGLPDLEAAIQRVRAALKGGSTIDQEAQAEIHKLRTLLDKAEIAGNRAAELRQMVTLLEKRLKDAEQKSGPFVVGSPLEVRFASGHSVTLAPETHGLMVKMANATKKHESAFLLEGRKGWLFPAGEICRGGTHSCRIPITGAHAGYFHTHPGDQDPGWHSDQALSGNDLAAILPGQIACVSGAQAPDITCATLKSGEPRAPGGHYIPYIHPNVPQEKAERILAPRPTGVRFRPEVGQSFEYVSIPKVLPQEKLL